jgi:hypothetical protein
MESPGAGFCPRQLGRSQDRPALTTVVAGQQLSGDTLALIGGKPQQEPGRKRAAHHRQHLSYLPKSSNAPSVRVDPELQC